jgi:hypothetical protein
MEYVLRSLYLQRVTGRRKRDWSSNERLRLEVSFCPEDFIEEFHTHCKCNHKWDAEWSQCLFTVQAKKKNVTSTKKTSSCPREAIGLFFLVEDALYWLKKLPSISSLIPYSVNVIIALIFKIFYLFYCWHSGCTL